MIMESAIRTAKSGQTVYFVQMSGNFIDLVNPEAHALHEDGTPNNAADIIAV